MSGNIVELVSLDPSLVEFLLEEDNSVEVTARVCELAKSLDSLCSDLPVYPFLVMISESLLPHEALRQEAVNALIGQQAYWRGFYKEIQKKSVSLADYLNIVHGLALASMDGKYLARLITYNNDSHKNEKTLAFSSLAGDNDFWSNLKNNKIKTMMVSDTTYGTNHHPFVSISELGIKPEQVEALYTAHDDLLTQFYDLFRKIGSKLTNKGGALYGIQKDLVSYNPASITMALLRKHKGSTIAEVLSIYEEFRQQFNDYVDKEEWENIFSNLKIIDEELGKLITIGQSHIKD